MIVDFRRRNIYVANIKCASTAIESVLIDVSSLHLRNAEHGKHLPLRKIQSILEQIVPSDGIKEFSVFGSIRNPISWLVSIYTSHGAEQFAGTNLSSREISFEQYINKGLDESWDQLTPQIDRFKWSDGEVANCLWIPLSDPGPYLSHHWFGGGRTVIVPRKNVSFTELVAPIECSDATLRRIGKQFSEDVRLHLQQCGSIAPHKSMRANQIINLLRDDIEKVNKRASNIGFKSVSNHDVVSCFRALLNRDPESAEVVEHHRQIGTLQGVIERITASEEYRHIIAQKCARVETSPKTPSLMP